MASERTDTVEPDGFSHGMHLSTRATSREQPVTTPVQVKTGGNNDELFESSLREMIENEKQHNLMEQYLNGITHTREDHDEDNN